MSPFFRRAIARARRSPTSARRTARRVQNAGYAAQGPAITLPAGPRRRAIFARADAIAARAYVLHRIADWGARVAAGVVSPGARSEIVALGLASLQ